jgi:hypothetical protein
MSRPADEGGRTENTVEKMDACAFSAILRVRRDASGRFSNAKMAICNPGTLSHILLCGEVGADSLENRRSSRCPWSDTECSGGIVLCMERLTC